MMIVGPSVILKACIYKYTHTGDFAVLLRAGMSIRQAIVYNCVSSLLCIIGMVIGVAIGNIHSASIWIFAGVGGMFLYISMVDMVSIIYVNMMVYVYKQVVFNCRYSLQYLDILPSAS